MSYNGSGTFQINSTGQPVVSGTVISSTAFNALTADLATGLSTAITKDGQTATTARIPFAQGINSTLVTDSTSTTTGSIITAGGAGVAKALFVGTTANVAGAVTLQSTLGVTGVTTVQAGTAALPAITTTGDTNTGIFFPAADTIAFSEGGVERARINSSGNLGLGVIPSPWDTFTASFQIDGASLSGLGANNTALASNAYYQGAWKYYGTGSASLYQQNAGQHAWSVAGSGTAGNAISFTQALTLNANGALALQGAASANGIGITFPATQSASSDANTLDDYEEGTWTPAQGGGLTVVGAYSSSGQYTKIGRQVTVAFTIAGATTIAVTAGGIITTNLPFTALTSFDQAGTVFRFGAAGGQCIAAGGDTRVYNGAAIAAGGGLNILITYFV